MIRIFLALALISLSSLAAAGIQEEGCFENLLPPRGTLTTGFGKEAFGDISPAVAPRGRTRRITLGHWTMGRLVSAVKTVTAVVTLVRPGKSAGAFRRSL